MLFIHVCANALILDSVKKWAEGRLQCLTNVGKIWQKHKELHRLHRWDIFIRPAAKYNNGGSNFTIDWWSWESYGKYMHTYVYYLNDKFTQKCKFNRYQLTRLTIHIQVPSFLVISLILEQINETIFFFFAFVF